MKLSVSVIILIIYIIAAYIFFVVWLIKHPEDRCLKQERISPTAYIVYNYGTVPGQFICAFIIVVPILSAVMLLGVLIEKFINDTEFSENYIKVLVVHNIILYLLLLLSIK